MKIFDQPNMSNNWKCPICNTNDDKEVVLIDIQGTEDGNIMQAEQFHLDCIALYYFKDAGIIMQRFIREPKND